MKINRLISSFVLLSFLGVYIIHPTAALAAQATGTLRIFSETKGIKVYVNEDFKGTDIIEVTGLEPGDHYVKIVKDDAVLYSELVRVSAGATTAVLIKTKAPSQEQVLDKLYDQQQEYKQGKIDILLSKGMASYGTSYTSSTYYPGYYSLFGSGWTTSSSIAYETTDWKIVKGGLQQISDRAFANMVGDKDTIARMDKDLDDYNNLMGWGAGVALIGVALVLAGGAVLFSEDSAAVESGAVIFTIGILPLIIGLGMLSKDPPSGHYVTPLTAAKQAYEYNQSLKKKLGLPASYEPK